MYLWNFSCKSVTNTLSYPHPSNRHMRYGKNSRCDSDIKTEDLCKISKKQIPLFFSRVNITSWSSNIFDASIDKTNVSQTNVSAWIIINNNHQGLKACSSMSLIRTLGGGDFIGVEIHCKHVGKDILFVCIFYCIICEKWHCRFWGLAKLMSHIILLALPYRVCKWSFISSVPHMLLIIYIKWLWLGVCFCTMCPWVTVYVSGLLWISNWRSFSLGRTRREGRRFFR